MVSKATDHEAILFGDEFVADEIITRLPARCAVRCTVLSKRFRQLVLSPHFWLRQRRLGALLELPHAARLQSHDGCNAIYFHVVGPTFVMEHAFSMEHGSWYASTCNGLILVSGNSNSDDNRGQSSVDGVVFNPATKEEARMSLQLPHPGKEDVDRIIIGFGYEPSGKVYKALIVEADEDSTRLMVVSLDGNGGQEPRMIFSYSNDTDCHHILHTADGKVYFLIDENSDMSVAAFDFDSEAMTRITIPEGHDISPKMLELRGRPCIYMQKGRDTLLWLLTTDHRWEQLYILVKESSRWDDFLKGVWDCGGGFLFVEFEHSGAHMYNLNEAVREEKEGSNRSRLAAVSSLKFEHKWPMHNCSMNLSDYQPTLISPASILGDAALSSRGRESVVPKHQVDKTFLEITQKSVIDPIMLMLSVLRPLSSELD